MEDTLWTHGPVAFPCLGHELAAFEDSGVIHDCERHSRAPITSKHQRVSMEIRWSPSLFSRSSPDCAIALQLCLARAFLRPGEISWDEVKCC